ncbi:MAG TPA: hypothetical protein VGJ74_02580 [Burkholderiales bacterium]|jgi:hypothetical protein
MRLSRTQLNNAVKHIEAGEWQAAHEIVQRDEDSPLACWAHGIVHIMEGDLPNARYWYEQAKRQFPVKPVVRTEIAALRATLEGER